MKKLLLALVTISVLVFSCFASAPAEDESNFRLQKIFDLELQVERLENREKELEAEIKCLSEKLEESKKELHLREMQVKYLMERN